MSTSQHFKFPFLFIQILLFCIPLSMSGSVIFLCVCCMRSFAAGQAVFPSFFCAPFHRFVCALFVCVFYILFPVFIYIGKQQCKQ